MTGKEEKMAIILILTFTMLGMWAALVFCYRMGAVENGKYLLGITLDGKYRKAPEVTGITKSYQSRMRRINGISLAACVPVLLMNGYMSFTFLFLMIWFGLSIYFHQENVSRCAHSLYALKQKKGWLAGNPHVVRIDTVLSSVKDAGAVPFWWFVPAWLIGLGGCLWAWKGGPEGLGQAGGGLGLYARAVTLCFVWAELLFTAAYVGIRKSKKQVYCSDSSANRKIDHVVRHEWSRCMVLHAYGMAAFTLFMGWMAGNKGQGEGWAFRAGNGAAYLFALLLAATGSFCAIYAAFHNVKKTKTLILESLSGETVELYGDDDEYWLNGYPPGKRPAGLTEKRIGVGWTTSPSLVLNMAEKAVLAFIALFTLGISLFLMPYDFANISMEIEGNSCRISGASMGYSFELDSVEEISLLEERPNMSKKSGYDSNRFFLGDFRVQGYGTCKVYVSLKNDSVIKVVTSEKIVWFNSESKEETLRFYEELKAREIRGSF